MDSLFYKQVNGLRAAARWLAGLEASLPNILHDFHQHQDFCAEGIIF